MCEYLGSDSHNVRIKNNKPNTSMKIENVITYTLFSSSHNAHYEKTTWIQRPYKLTVAGAQRIIRKDHPAANVVRVETLLRA